MAGDGFEGVYLKLGQGGLNESDTGAARGNRVECAGNYSGHSDSALTRRGLHETSALLAALAASDYRIEGVYASPLGRAWQMGQSLAKGFRCPLTAEPALKEQAFGQFEGVSSELLIQNYPNISHDMHNPTRVTPCSI